MNELNGMQQPLYYDLTSDDQPVDDEITSQPNEDPNMVCILQRYRESLEQFVKITAVTKSLDKKRLILEKKRELLRKTMNQLRLIYGLAKARQSHNLRKRSGRYYASQRSPPTTSVTHVVDAATVPEDLRTVRVGEHQQQQSEGFSWASDNISQFETNDKPLMLLNMGDSCSDHMVMSIEEQEVPLDYSLRNERTVCSLERL